MSGPGGRFGTQAMHTKNKLVVNYLFDSREQYNGSNLEEACKSTGGTSQYQNNNWERVRKTKEIRCKSLRPGLTYTYKPIYDSQNQGWVEYIDGTTNYGTVDAFLQFLNNEKPIKAFREKFGLKHTHVIRSADINDTSAIYFEPRLYISFDE